MKTLLLSLAIALPASFASAASEADLTPQRVLEINALMVQAGYDVANMKIEDEMFEVYATKDGERFEVFLNDDLEIVEIKED